MADRSGFLKAMEELRKSGQFDLSSLGPLPEEHKLNIPNRADYNFNPSDWNQTFGGTAEAPKKEGGNGQAWWRDLLGAMGGIGSGGTDFVAHQFDEAKKWVNGNASLQKILKGDVSFKNIDDLLGEMNPVQGTLNRLISGGVEGQRNAWKDGINGFEDIPGVGFFMGMNDKAQHGEDILQKLGANPDSKATTWGGVGLDIALDPTTYLTFGAGSLAKAGARAGETAAAKAATSIGAKVGRNADETIANIQQKLMTKLGDPVKVEEALTGVQKSVDEATKSARFKAQNSLINYDVPFTNITGSVANKPTNIPFTKVANPFIKTENLIIPAQASHAAGILDKLAGGDRAQAADLLKRTYGIDDVSKMNTQQFDHLVSQFERTGGKSIFPPAADPFAQTATKAPDMSVVPFRQAPPPAVTRAADNVAEDMPQQLQTIIKSIPSDGAESIKSVIRGELPASKLSPAMQDVLKELLRVSDETGLVGKSERLGLPGTSIEDFGKRASRANNKATPTYDGDFTSILEGDILNAGRSSRTAGRNVVDGEFSDILGGAGKQADEAAGSAAASTARQADEAFSPSLEKFVQDAGGQTALGRWARGTKIGKALTARDGHIASTILDADQAAFAGRQIANKRVKAVDNIMKGLSEAQRREVVDVVEGTAKASTVQIGDAAAELQKILKGVEGDELSSGVLKETIDNYFPHVLDGSPEDMAKFEKIFADDPKLQSAMSHSSKSKFSQGRKSFNSMKELDDYLKAVHKDLSVLPVDSAERKALQEKYDTVSKLFERDPAKALQRRLNTSARSVAMAKMYKQFKRDGLLFDDLENIPRHVGEAGDFVRLTGREAKKFGFDSDVYMHREIKDGIEKTRELFTEKGMNDLVETLDRVNGLWKTLRTTLKPSHHLYNFIGNVAVNAMVGVRPTAYTKAVKMTARFSKGNPTEADWKLMKEMLERGVLFGGDASEYMKPFKKAWRIEKVMYDNPYTKLMNKIGNSTDGITRMAHFFHVAKQTGSAKMAADSVRKHLFNYREITKMDKGIRLFVPFWNWTKRNLPLQIEKLMQQPRYAQTYSRIQDAMMSNAEKDNAAIPDYAKGSSFYAGGAGFNPRLPLSDLDSLSNPLDLAVNAVGPMKTAFEVKGNQNLYTEKPIDYNLKYQGKRDWSAWGDYSAKQLGIVKDITDILNITGARDKDTHQRSSAGEDILKLLRGAIYGGKQGD